jgi:hypothetical protein
MHVCPYLCLSYPACKSHLSYVVLFAICGLSGSTILFALSHKLHKFWIRVIEYKMCVLIFSTTLVWSISHPTNHSARYCHSVHKSSCKVPVILVRFQKNFSFLNKFLKKPQISNLLTACPVWAELFHVDRQAGRRDKANCCFSQLCDCA